MISYRKLAMRVLGHPLRVPTPPRPASHRVTALALTAAMVAGMAAPAYADVYYIGDGDITITKDENGTQVQQGNSTKNDTDRDIVIKGGTNPANTASGGSSSGSNSSKSTTLAKSPAKSMSATPPSEDSDSENEDKVYLGDTKGSGEENKNQLNNNTTTTGSEENKDQTDDTTGGEENENQTGDTTGGEENENQPSGTTGGEENKNQPSGTTGGEENENQPGGTTGGEENENQPSGTTGGEENKNQPSDTTGGEENENQTGGTSGGEKNETDFTKKTQSSDSPVLGSQLTYTGAPINVANANDDDETRDESTTVLERAAENFNNTAKNITNYVIRIINKATGNDNTLNVTLEDVNIKANNDAALSVEGAGNTTITLKGDNTLTSGYLHAGLEHNEKSEDGSKTGKLTITSETDGKGNNTGSLKATAGDGCAAGIGGARNNGAGIIEIAGGNITANGGNGSDGGAGIGSGSRATGNTNTNITISGGTVKAKGGDNGAGIGGGQNSGKSIIKILKGIIGTVTGGSYSAGIGGGQSSESEVHISGGTIDKVSGGERGAGIGSGYIGGSSTVNISGNAELKDVKGGNLAAGIGSGYDSGKVDVVIDGGTIKATGGDSAAGIGSGHNSRSSVTIKSGTVNATGNGTGAGIGGSDNNNSSSITITGGTIIANGTGEAPAIGGGSVSISNADAPLDITATAPDAANAIQSNDGKTLDKVISLMENGKKGLVKLVESGTNSLSRLFHNGVYAASHSTSHSPDRVTPEMSEAEKAKYGDIASVHNWKVSDHQEPTCGKDGYIDYICMVDHCGTTFRHTLPATGQHTWNEGVVTKKPTCTELGVRTFTCTVCHNTRTEAIEAPGHEYGEWVIDRDATCVKEGSKHRDCVRGDATQTESIPATGQHQWKLLSTTAATCGQDGTVTYKCAVCGDTKTETLNATGQHSYGAGVVTKAATCAEPGIMTYTCVVCGAPKTESIPVDKSTHKWDAGVVTKEPTCTADGVRTFTCSVCGDTRTEAIKALGHEYGEWVIDRDATCVEDGSKHRDCIRGDDTQTEAIPVSKTHTFGEWVITKEPTCTEKGERQRSCTISGCVVTETEELPALGHQWSDWTPVKGDSRREYRICEVCNEVEYRDVSHNSDSSISTGLRVLDPAQTNIIQNVQLVQLSQINHTLYIHVAQETASLQGDLSDLTDLRSKNIKTVVFSTESCTSTLSLSDVAALGAGSTPFTLSHSGSTATFIVGGADHTALLR